MKEFLLLWWLFLVKFAGVFDVNVLRVVTTVTAVAIKTVFALSKNWLNLNQMQGVEKFTSVAEVLSSKPLGSTTLFPWKPRSYSFTTNGNVIQILILDKLKSIILAWKLFVTNYAHIHTLSLSLSLSLTHTHTHVQMRAHTHKHAIQVLNCE